MPQFHIDTDMGVDDALALVVAGRIADFELKALSTVFGNVPVETATRNACLLRYLSATRPDLQIFRGADRASDGFRRDAVHVFGDDGLGSAVSALAQDDRIQAALDDCRAIPIPDHARSQAGPVTIIGLGPATNVPQLVAYYGATNVKRIVLMSGVFFDIGNISAEAEFNANCDPIALQATLDLNIPATLVPLDVCRKVLLTRSTVRTYLQFAPTELMKLIVESHMHYMDYCLEWEGIDGCFPFDSIAVLVASRPDKFFSIRGRVAVDAGKHQRGRTRVTADDKSHVDIVLGGI
jgi:inosine-uridine nucleoside N-ribohydrolase